MLRCLDRENVRSRKQEPQRYEMFSATTFPRNNGQF